jgi:proteasome lid subunit RPN8/RPN11
LADAARAALAEALPLSDRFEHGGALVNCAGTYRYTAPVTTRDPEHVEYEARVPRGCTLAGLYHTHPSSADSAGMFSPDDVRTSRALRVPSFIGIRRDGSIRVFDPASMSAARERGRLSYGASARGALLTKE